MNDAFLSFIRHFFLLQVIYFLIFSKNKVFLVFIFFINSFNNDCELNSVKEIFSLKIKKFIAIYLYLTNILFF